MTVPDTLLSQTARQLVVNGQEPKDLGDFLVLVRRHLHRNPEIGLHEYETARFIRELFERNGLSVQPRLARTGLYVDIVGTEPGPTVAYRADIDALPIKDAKTVPYASQNDGVAHLCGHDVHSTIAIGAALLLRDRRSAFKGTVRVFFQPNEEGIPSGAPLMIRDGVLRGVDLVLASHVDPTLPTGTFGLIKGPATASADRFRMVVSGTATGHSARPHQSVDTVWVATQIMNALYQQIGRRSDARNTAVLAICRMQGGDAYNVIPKEVEFGGTFRCTDNNERVTIKNLFLDTAMSIGRVYGAHVEVEFDLGSPPVINDPDLIDIVARTIEERHGPEAIFRIPRPSMGAEDFAHYLEQIPGAMIRIGTSGGPETSHVLHDSSFDVDESAMLPASELIAATLVRCLEHRASA